MLRRDNLSALEVDRCSDGAATGHSRHSCICKLINPQENLTMKKTLSSLTVAVLALFGAQAAMAQAASSPSRADVKKEAADANKAASKSGVPDAAAGQQAPKAAAATSTTTRDDRKKSAAEANKAASKSVVPDAAAGQQSPKAAAATSDTTRDDRKKTTAEANKAGTIPATEAQMQAPKK